jgi:hypothetical protein
MPFFAMAMSGKIIDLRHLLAIRFPQAPMLVGTRLVTGLASFDQPIGGGLPKGGITSCFGCAALKPLKQLKQRICS